MNMNPEVFIIGLISLGIVFTFPLIKNKTIGKLNFSASFAARIAFLYPAGLAIPKL
jgi:hypothetical protein